jgi:orotidine-5'-phosphate decarboxylase
MAGLHGVVCSGLEAKRLRTETKNDFLLVTPGIRPASASKDDQRRVLTPPQALKLGANYLVIGRPITKASNPTSALEAILQDI